MTDYLLYCLHHLHVCLDSTPTMVSHRTDVDISSCRGRGLGRGLGGVEVGVGVGVGVWVGVGVEVEVEVGVVLQCFTHASPECITFILVFQTAPRERDRGGGGGAEVGWLSSNKQICTAACQIVHAVAVVTELSRQNTRPPLAIANIERQSLLVLGVFH